LFIIITITVRLAFLAHSVRMWPDFQGLPWSEGYGLGEYELLIRFFLSDELENQCDFIFG